MAFNFEKFKKKAEAAADSLADKTVEIAKKAADKTKSAAKIAKLNTDIAVEENAIKKNFTEIGRIYYAMSKDAPDDSVAALVMQVTAAMERIELLKDEIEKIKDDGDASAAAEEPCCCGCDDKSDIPDEQDAEDMASALKTASDSISDAIDEVVDEIKGEDE